MVLLWRPRLSRSQILRQPHRAWYNHQMKWIHHLVPMPVPVTLTVILRLTPFPYVTVILHNFHGHMKCKVPGNVMAMLMWKELTHWQNWYISCFIVQRNSCCSWARGVNLVWKLRCRGFENRVLWVLKIQQTEAFSTGLWVSLLEFLFNYIQISIFLKSYNFWKVFPSHIPVHYRIW